MLSAPIPSDVAKFLGQIESNIISNGLQGESNAVTCLLGPPVGDGDLLYPMPARLDGLNVYVIYLPVLTNLLSFF